MKLLAFGATVVLLSVCSQFGGYARVAPLGASHRAAVSLYKTVIEKFPTGSVGDIWSDCSKASDKLKIGSVSVTPDPPKKGDVLNVKALVNFTEQVTGGTVKVNLDIDKIPFISLNLDLCELLSDAGLSCPVSAGPQTLTVSQEIPDEAPSGNYTGNQYLYDQNNNELACVALMLNL